MIEIGINLVEFLFPINFDIDTESSPTDPLQSYGIVTNHFSLYHSKSESRMQLKFNCINHFM